MTHDWWIGKDLVGNCRSLIKVLSRFFPGSTEKKKLNPSGRMSCIPAGIRIDRLPNTGLEHCHYRRRIGFRIFSAELFDWSRIKFVLLLFISTRLKTQEKYPCNCYSFIFQGLLLIIYLLINLWLLFLAYFVKVSKVKISLFQAVEAHRVARG
jgi:hypothetical protein